MNDLFDSLNGSSTGKGLRGVVTRDSAHSAFWTRALEILRSTHFLKNGQPFYPPSLKNMITTIKRVQVLVGKLFDMDIDEISLRHFNQDPIENFFGSIRALGIQNPSPNAPIFTSNFKSRFFTAYVGTHSAHANCEADKEKRVITTLKKLVNISSEIIDQTVVNLDDVNADINSFTFSETRTQHFKHLSRQLSQQVSKAVLRRLNCATCKKFLSPFTNCPQETCWLDTDLMCLTSKLCVIAEKFLPLILHQSNISQKLKLIVCKLINNVPVCNEHNLLDLVLSVFIKLYIRIYIRRINRIFKGDIIQNPDPLQARAKSFYVKYFTKKRDQ
jgi:hypothetical protein